MEVFVGKGLDRVAGSVDDADGLPALEDGDGEGVCPAGVGAGLGEAPGTGNREGWLGGFDDELDHVAVRRCECAGLLLPERGQFGDCDQADPVRL